MTNDTRHRHSLPPRGLRQEQCCRREHGQFVDPSLWVVLTYEETARHEVSEEAPIMKPLEKPMAPALSSKYLQTQVPSEGSARWTPRHMTLAVKRGRLAVVDQRHD
jgi:hypothetical protein